MKNNNESIVRVLKFSISVFSILPIINFIGIANTSYALFTKDVDSKNSIKFKTTTHTTPEKGSGAEKIQNIVGKRQYGECSTDEINNTGLAYDCTNDNNLRYVGKDPNNYVSFNNELWRIIGVMNNIEDGSGNLHSQLKLVRNESIGSYIWDTSISTINGGNGINEWSQADLMKLLNPGYESESNGGSLYWNKKSGKCYSGQNNYTTTCDFSKTGISEYSKSYIDSIVWNTSAFPKAGSYTPQQTYLVERNNKIGSNSCTTISCNDSVSRTTSWVGRIGLFYASDYGFATNSNKDERNLCLSYTIRSWKNSNSLTSKCVINNWLYNNFRQWTISPFAKEAFGVMWIDDYGGADYNYNYFTMLVKPSLYLKPNVKITGGTGTQTDPYKLSL